MVGVCVVRRVRRARTKRSGPRDAAPTTASMRRCISPPDPAASRGGPSVILAALTMTPLQGITVLDLTRVLSGPVLHDDARRHGRPRHQGRADRQRRRHARVGPAVRERRERLFPQHQSEQGKHHPRLQARRGTRHCSNRLIAQGRRARRELQARNARQARARLRNAVRAVSAPDLLLDLRVRSHRTAAEGSRVRRGDAGRGRAHEHHRLGRRSTLPPRCRDRRHRVRHVCGAGGHGRPVTCASGPDAARKWTSPCSTRSWRSSATRRASTSPTVSRRRGSATVTRPSSPTRRFAASDGDFVVAVGNDDQWRRFCAVTGFPDRRTVRHEPRSA